MVIKPRDDDDAGAAWLGRDASIRYLKPEIQWVPMSLLMSKKPNPVGLWA